MVSPGAVGPLPPPPLVTPLSLFVANDRLIFFAICHVSYRERWSSAANAENSDDISVFVSSSSERINTASLGFHQILASCRGRGGRLRRYPLRVVRAAFRLSHGRLGKVLRAFLSVERQEKFTDRRRWGSAAERTRRETQQTISWPRRTASDDTTAYDASQHTSPLGSINAVGAVPHDPTLSHSLLWRHFVCRNANVVRWQCRAV